jgi:hypothetical protein
MRQNELKMMQNQGNNGKNIAFCSLYHKKFFSLHQILTFMKLKLNNWWWQILPAKAWR